LVNCAYINGASTWVPPVICFLLAEFRRQNNALVPYIWSTITGRICRLEIALTMFVPIMVGMPLSPAA
jgi:hypothetical protein